MGSELEIKGVCMPPITINPKGAGDITLLVYILQGISFFFGVTYLAAVIVNYVKRDTVQGTWLESHFTWQIQTFWYTVLWGVVGLFTYWIFLGYWIWALIPFWMLYRIIKGLIRLREGKPMNT